jgi:uroporphyrinogen-III synthase
MGSALRLLSLKLLPKAMIQHYRALNVRIDQQEVIRLLPQYDENEVNGALQHSNQLIFTSFEAVNAIQKHLTNETLKDKRIVCIGERSVAFFKQLGFNTVHSDNAALLCENCAMNDEWNTVYFHGNRSLGTIVKYFKKHNIPLQQVEVYHCELLYPKIQDLHQYQLFLFFSPSGVESFFRFNTLPKGALTGAIGITTAQSLPDPTTLIASSTNAKTLIQESIHHYSTHVGNH